MNDRGWVIYRQPQNGPLVYAPGGDGDRRDQSDLPSSHPANGSCYLAKSKYPRCGSVLTSFT
jgi:hypothetical protein